MFDEASAVQRTYPLSGSALPASRLSVVADGSDQGRCPASRPSPSGSLGSTAVQERVPGREQESHYGAATKARFRGHSRGAARADQRIGRGRDGERAVGEADQEPADWAAFGVVGVQQGLVGQATTDWVNFQPRLQSSWMPVFMPWAPAGLCTWAASHPRCARPGSGRHGSAVRSRPARRGHVTGACRRQGRRPGPPATAGPTPAGRRGGLACPRASSGGRPSGKKDRMPSGPRKACTVSRSSPPSTSPGRRGIGAMASYDARGLLIAGIPWRHAMS